LAREPTTVNAARTDYGAKNKLQAEDQQIHSWYRFVLGYPPHLVREYLQSLGADPKKDWLLDPFCGTGTTPVEARLHGFSTISADANPISVLATKVKLSWDIDLEQARLKLDQVLALASLCIERASVKFLAEPETQLTLPMPQVLEIEPRYSRYYEGKAKSFDPNGLLSPKTAALIPAGFISRRPLLYVLSLRYAIEILAAESKIRDFMRLALANTIVTTAGNIGFGPEIYRLPPRGDADVLGAFAAAVMRMSGDVRELLIKHTDRFPPAHVARDDARTLTSLNGLPRIGVVITSPPYPNEKDYTRSTRLESVLLGLIGTKQDLRGLKSGLLRSNTRNVFVEDDDDTFIKDIPSIVSVAQEIEQRRKKLGKTSGFERLYHRVTRLYFGGMYRHFRALLPHLRSGARCAYVVGDQMSYFRIHIRTAELLADVAMKAGYKVEGIELWRTRRSTTTGQHLDENVLIIKRPSNG
jgi:DNA modification methylase